MKRLRTVGAGRAAAAAFFLTVALLAIEEQRLWADPFFKLSQSAENEPRSWRLRLLVGEQAERRLDFPAAEAAYREGGELNRDFARAEERTLLPRLLLIQLFEKEGEFARARSEIESLPIGLLPRPPAEYFQHYLFTLQRLGDRASYARVLSEGKHYYTEETLTRPPLRPRIQ
jgi:hypothetical protein